MKTEMIKKIISILAMLISLNASAGLFGASTFEECMSDGKVGRTNAELNLLKAKCRKEFPVLPKLYALKNARISCSATGGEGTEVYKVNGNKVNDMPITYRKNEQIVFTGIKIDVKNEGIKIAKSTIDTLNGIHKITFDADGRSISFEYDCTEN